jgi:hypothetical protein
MITAFRGGRSLKDNQSRNTQLLKDFRQTLGNPTGYGAHRLIGHWKECSVNLPKGKTVGDCSDLGGELKDVLEETWLVLNDKNTDSKDFFDTACKMAEKYNQDSFLARTKYKNFGVYSKDGSELAPFSVVNDKTFRTGFVKIIDVQGYSELKKVKGAGRVFSIVIESLNIGVNIPYYTISERREFKYLNLLED